MSIEKDSFIGRILNFPNSLMGLMYKSDKKEELDPLMFLVMINFGLIVFFWFTRKYNEQPMYIWECLGLLLGAKFGQSFTSAYRQTGGLTVQRHIYNSTTSTVPSRIDTTNSSPAPDRPRQATTIIDDEGQKRTGKKIHVEGNPEEEV